MKDADKLNTDIPKRDLIEGLMKGIDVISAFNGEARRMTVSEMAKTVGLTRTAARRYLLTLVHIGLAATDGKEFWLTPRVLNLGRSYLDSAHVPNAVVPFLQRLTQQLQESTNFSILDGPEVVYLTRVIAPRLVTAGFEPGTRLPAYTSTAGRVLLSTLSDPEIRAYLGGVELIAYTHMTVTDKDQLFRELQEIRHVGYAVTESQYELGMRGISVAVKNRRGALIGAISVSMNVASCSREEAISRCIPALQATANTLMMWL
ncbi:transcriptional regulator, IclR family [Noviherbaspirillum humi]|uniref:Transcriptional regulator, IclR family n=1 Tax=Noviherbaspirillum humi TaxID=1688639 RepID=A0A239HTG1_9BURK|nr:IclR family transcriptional regulator C-terminal domain-containing protein [Noviherbaspirillum humi]SNS84626.1 transcriptional regulator, IclR family [Noviherbaspirillum humi]